MAGLIDIKFLGDKELQRKLELLSKVAQGKAVRSAMRKAAVPVRDRAKALVPRVTGVNTDPLRKGIKIVGLSRRQKKRGAVGVQIVTPSREELGIGRDDKYYYPTAIELGTRNAAAVPFFRNAMEEKRAESTAIAAREIGRSIIKAAMKK